MRTINITDGTVLNKASVEGYNTWGESTRDFVYDPTRRAFYMLDVDFTKAAPSGGRPVVLYSINADTGATTNTSISEMKGYVYGYAFHEASGRIHAAVEHGTTMDDSSSRTGWSFYWIDVDSGKATHVVDVPVKDPTDESDAACYAGYHRGVSSDGTQVMRLGFKSVVEQANPGVGVVDLPSGGPVWRTDVPIPVGYDFYLSFHPFGENTFVSLAPNSTSQQLSVISWSLNATESTILALLGNAESPRVMGQGTLGFTLDAMRSSDSMYIAVVDQENPVPIPEPGALDRWAVVVIDDLNSAQHTARTVVLDPFFMVGSNSLSGVGLPALRKQ